MSDDKRVDVVLATYNGGRFLSEQLRSLAAQTYRHWRLLARDDGSADETVAILLGFARENDDRVRILETHGERLGAIANFGELLAASTAPYVALCDQDDVWLPEKLELLLGRMRWLEEKHGAAKSIVVHSDARVVDAGLRELAPSLWRYQGLDPFNAPLETLMLANVATGCTLVANRAALKRALPIPREAAMHDWWLALVARAFGVLDAFPHPTVFYRQHASNEAGAHEFRPLRMLVRAVAKRPGRMRATLAQSTCQAAAFEARFGGELQPAARRTLTQYGALRGMGPLARRAFLLRHRVMYPDLARNALLFAVV